jgi:hypothetical protein
MSAERRKSVQQSAAGLPVIPFMNLYFINNFLIFCEFTEFLKVCFYLSLGIVLNLPVIYYSGYFLNHNYA